MPRTRSAAALVAKAHMDQAKPDLHRLVNRHVAYFEAARVLVSLVRAGLVPSTHKSRAEEAIERINLSHSDGPSTSDPQTPR